MCRPGSKRTFWFAVLLSMAMLMTARAVHADDVAAYLEQHGLKQLLAMHLEQQLASADAAARSEILHRLANLYAELLEAETDDNRRAALEQRSRDLLEQAPAGSADALRLALLRGAYRAVERVAESHRLRTTQPGDVETATRALADLIPKLAELREQLHGALTTAERRLIRSSGVESVVLNEEFNRISDLHAQCTFLNAWSLYYQGWLLHRPEIVRAAEPLFAEILKTETLNPQPDDVSLDLRSMEGIARAILGMTLCKSMTASSSTALAWLELLEHPETYEPLRAQAPVWRIVVHLEYGEFDRVRELLDEMTKDNVQVPVIWYRLAAVHALEAQGQRQADELARHAVTQLAAAGDLQQVLDLANRYGTQSLGSSGFAVRYVRGILEYQDVRTAHGSDEPTNDPQLQQRYREASALLTASLNEADASNYARAASAAQGLIAWCHFFCGDYFAARTAFEEASRSHGGSNAAELLWMAIVSLDRAIDAGAAGDAESQLTQLIDRFLFLYPSSEHAPKLLLRRSLAASNPSPHLVEDLLSIPPNSDVYAAAQHRAADMLYQLFRRASERERLSYAQQYLAVAMPLITSSVREIDVNDSDSVDVLVVRCRQVLEVSLTEGVNRPHATLTALNTLDELETQFSVDLSPFRDEIACRRMQERLQAGDVQAATQMVDAMWAQDPRSTWTRIATRAISRHGYSQWKQSDQSFESQQDAIELVVRYGGRVLHEFSDAADPLQPAGSLGYHAAVAEASMTLWERTGNAERGRAALFLYERLLARQPNNAAFLRAVGLLAAHFGDQFKAIDCWRKLAAGLPERSPQWFEAKFHLIQSLASIDPARARDVMDQHKQLHPDYGIEPWGEKLRALDASLGSEAAQGQPGDAADNGGAAP